MREIEAIADNTEFDDILWGADMNWHIGRDTGAMTVDSHCPIVKQLNEWQSNWVSNQSGKNLTVILHIPYRPEQ